MLSLLGSKLDEPRARKRLFITHSLQSMTMENLTKLKITFAGLLYLKPNSNERIAVTMSLGQDQLWSFANLYSQLHLLESLISRTVCQRVFKFLTPRQTESGARAWIDTFRASAMLPSDKRMVFGMERAVSATTVSPSSLSTLSGFTNYTAIVARQRAAGKSASTYFKRSAHCFL